MYDSFITIETMVIDKSYGDHELIFRSADDLSSMSIGFSLSCKNCKHNLSTMIKINHLRKTDIKKKPCCIWFPFSSVISLPLVLNHKINFLLKGSWNHEFERL